MTASSEFQKNLVRVCEILRGAGLPDANIEALAEQWSQKTPTELQELTNALKALEAAALGLLAERSPRTHSATKYPNIKVQLHDLGGKVGPILRRVSYAMADAGIDEAEIEQYKREVTTGGDPVDVAKRWVAVE